MPFVAFEHVENLLPEALRNLLQDRTEIYNDLERQASIIVRDMTGRDIPASVPEAFDVTTDWVVTPMGWLIASLGQQHCEFSDITIKTVESNYAKAMKLLDRHKSSPTATSNTLASVFQYKGDMSW